MEHNHNHPPLLLEAVPRWLAAAFREYRIPFLGSLIWGTLAYLFAFTNKLVNHDEVGQLFGKGATVSSGRWGLGALDLIFPNVSMPWIYGVITLVLMAVSVCLIIRLFSLRSKVLQVLLAGSIVIFPSLIGLFGYMFTSSSYALSFLLAVLAVFLVCRGSRWMLLPAAGCLILSVSIYQSYISVAASLMVLVLIHQLLTGEEPGSVLKKGIGYVLFLIISLGGYYLATQLVLMLKGISFNEYAADSISFSPSYLLKGLGLAYVNFVRFFTWAHHRLMPTSLSRWLHLALFAAAAVLLLLWVQKQKKPGAARFLLLLLLLVMLPLAINCMYLITSEDSIHTLVLYSFVSVYILVAVLAEQVLEVPANGMFRELLRRIALDGSAIALSVIILINIYVANTAYLNLHLRYENAYAFYTSLSADIRQLPQFREGSRIAVIGSWKSPDFYETNLDFTNYLIGTKGFLPSDYSAQAFLEYYIGFPAEFVSVEEAAAIGSSDAFREMSVYPYYGCIRVVDDVIVVKLSD